MTGVLRKPTTSASRLTFRISRYGVNTANGRTLRIATVRLPSGSPFARKREGFPDMSQFASCLRRHAGQVIHPTRNFATLGPLYLRPPFTGASITSFANRLASAG